MKYLFTFPLLLLAVAAFAQPLNDDCDGIVNLGPAPSCPTDVLHNNVGATASNIGADNIPGCWVGGNTNSDVWFSFVAVDTILDYRITLTACPDNDLGLGPIANPQIAVYRGDCEFDGLQLLSCKTSNNGDNIIELDLIGLTPGITYFFKVNDWSPTGTPNSGAFKLCITKKPPIFTIDEGGSTACSGTLTDTGGPDDDYGNNENFTYTICPDQPHNCINFTLEYYNIEQSVFFQTTDQFLFYDGPNAQSPLIANLSGAGDGANYGGVCYSVAAQSGCLTIVFQSDATTSFEGFLGYWECTTEACQPSAEISVQTGASPQEIVESIVGGQTTITITNIDCEGGQLGTFQAGPNSDLGLEKGMLLTSGSAANVANPGGFFTSVDLGLDGDSDLDYLSLLGGEDLVSVDACIVELDVFAATDEINFEYVFGSEEYPIFVNSEYNDIFAFLVSGPGIVGDPSIGNQQNVATLPNGDFIQINSVNYNTNWEFYRDNQNGQSVAYNGLTSDSMGIKKSLTARIETIPCNTYHLKIAIADRSPDFGDPEFFDRIYDSGVFISDIKGGSPNLGVTYNSGIDYLVESCVITPDVLNISLSKELANPVTYDIILGGTATQGLDYSLNLPGSVTFVTGQEVFSFDIMAIADLLPEGTETINIQLVSDFGCGATTVADLEILLYDLLEVEILDQGPDTILVCEGAGIQLQATGAQAYTWQPSSIFSNANISNPTADTDSSIWVTVTGNLGICSDMDSIFLQVIDPMVNISPTEETIYLCTGESVTLTAANNVGNSNLEWFTFFINLPDPNNPVQAITPGPGEDFIPLQVSVELGGCTAIDEVTIIVDPFDFPVVANDTTICENYSVQLASDIIGGTTTFSWTPSNSLMPSGDVSGPIATPDVTTTYTLIASSATGTCQDTAEVTVTVLPIDVAIQNPDTVFICLGESATLTNTNTTNNVGLTWSPNFFLNQISPQEVIVNPPVSTWYYAKLTSGVCTVTDSVLVYVDSLPDLTISALPNKATYCQDEEVTLVSPTYEPGNFPEIDLMWLGTQPGALTPDSFLNLVFNAIETHTYIRQTTVHACTSIDSIEIIVIPPMEIEIIPEMDTICPFGSVQFSVIGPPELENFVWSPAENFNNSTIREPIATAEVATIITLSAEYKGCPVGDTDTLFVHAFIVDAGPDQTVVAGEPVDLMGTSNKPVVSFTWTDKDGNVVATTANATVTTCEDNTYTLTGEDENGCLFSNSMNVFVTEGFRIDSVIGKEYVVNDSLIFEGEEFVLIAYTSPKVLPGATYDWYINDILVSTTNDTISEVLNAAEIFGPDNKRFETSSIKVEILIPVGCTSIDSNSVSIHNIPLAMPNAFSPNGDESNDWFQIVSNVPLTINEFKVWNRWGYLVYDNDNPEDGWDGKQKNEEAPSDVYIYKIVYQITGGSGKQYTQKGDVTLLR